MTSQDKSPHYRTFLLTLCLEYDSLDSPAVWHFRLVDPRSRQRHSFATLEAFTTALAQEMALDEANVAKGRNKEQINIYL